MLRGGPLDNSNRNDRSATSITIAGIASAAFVVVPLFIVILQILFYIIRLPFGGIPESDFQSFWVAARLALQGQALDVYNLDVHGRIQEIIHNNREILILDFSYPPFFLIFLMPIGMIDYVYAQAIWLMGSFVFYFISIRYILISLSWLPIFMAFPAVYWNAAYAQNGFLSAGLIAVAVHNLARRPVTAGVAFGLLAFKPHLGPLIPLALLVGGRWRVFFAASATVLTACAAATLVFGPSIWTAFFRMAGEAASRLDNGAGYLRMMASVYAGSRLLGASEPVSYVVQGMVAAITLIVIVRIIRLRPGAEAEGALIAASVTLCTPYLLRYDLVILAVPLAWLCNAAFHCASLRGERVLIVAAYVATAFSTIRVGGAEVLMAPVATIIVFVCVVRRCLASSRRAEACSEAGLRL